MSEEHTKTSENKPERDEKGRLLPGNTANPNGRPPGSLSLVSILKNELQIVPEGEKVSRAIAIIRKIATQAEEGDRHSQKLIMNYIDGMPRQNIGLEHSGKVENILSQSQIDELLRRRAKENNTSGEV